MPYGMLKPNNPWGVVLSTVAMTALLIGCYTPQASQGSDPSSRRTPSQVLPITATATIANQLFELEVAQTPRQQEFGLMYRTFMPPNRGMLFPFQPAQPVKFWMKHCLMSLDMIFLRQGTVVAIAAKAPPCEKMPCPVYGPDEPVDQVIEVKGGRTAEIGLKVGSRIEIKPVSKNTK
jgi:uncharacterized protein